MLMLNRLLIMNQKSSEKSFSLLMCNLSLAKKPMLIYYSQCIFANGHSEYYESAINL